MSEHQLPGLFTRRLYLLFVTKHAESRTIPAGGFENKYLQFVDASAILESVTIIPKPDVHYFNRALNLAPCVVDDDSTKFWVHSIGVTKQGET